MANDGIIQVPPDSTGKRVDGASLTVAGQVVFRQRMVVCDPSSSDRAALVTTAGALNVVGTVNISGTALCQVTGTVNISGTAAVVLGQSTNNIGGVSLVAGTSNIGFIDHVSATVTTAWATPQIVDSISKTVNTVMAVLDRTDPNTVRIGDSANSAMRVNIVAGTAAGVSQIDGTTFSTDAAPMVPIGAVFSDTGIGQSVSASNAGVLRMTAFRALHTNLHTDGGVKMDDSANQALRVNIVAGTAAGVSQVDGTTFSTDAAPFVPVGAVFSDTGTGQSISASNAGALRMTAFRGLHVNLRNSAGAEMGTPTSPLSIKVENISATSIVQLAAGTNNIGVVSLGAGTNNIGFINGISATVTIAGVISVATTVNVAIATPFTINNISATVTVTTSNPWVIAQPSASHGPAMTVISTSAKTGVVAAPGPGLQVYVTMVAVTNGGTVNTTARIGPSVSTSEVSMFMSSAGGGFVMTFDPPWKLPGNEGLWASVKPNSSGNCYFNVNFFVA